MVVCVYRAWSSIVEMYCTVARLRAAAVRVLVPLLRACLLHHPLRLEHVETKWLSPKPNKVAQPVAFYGSLSLGGSSQRQAVPRDAPSFRQPRASANRPLGPVRAGRPHTQALLLTQRSAQARQSRVVISERCGVSL